MKTFKILTVLALLLVAAINTTAMAITVNYGEKAEGAEIIDLQTAKENSNIDFNERDGLFQLFLDGIETEIENFIGAPVLLRENAEIYVSPWHNNIQLSVPISLITGIHWIDANDQETAITDYDVFMNEITIDLDKPQDFKRLRITAQIGYSPEEIPKDIKNAALLMFSERETYRENRPVKMNMSAQNLLRPYKLY